MPNPLRSFDGGATRDSDAGKLDFEGFLSPAVLWEFASYMDKHRHLPDGTMRGSDNWQTGMPLDVYVKSLLRHVFDLWLMHRGQTVVRPENGETVTLPDTLGGILFNLQGYWHEALKVRAEPSSDWDSAPLADWERDLLEGRDVSPATRARWRRIGRRV